MSTVNRVILVGNLGKDPEIRMTTAGKPIANLSLATSEFWKDKTPVRKKKKPNGTASSFLTNRLPGSLRSISRKDPRFTSKGLCKPANGKTRKGKTSTLQKWSCSALQAHW